jgi:uncharacterized membrane protein YcaP (DUF421 family)
MDAVIRAAVVYIFVLLLMRLSGKRTLAQVTTFDFVLLLIISEATQQALIDDDNSMINAAIAVTTLVGLNVLMSVLKQRFKFIERLLEGIPLVIVANGKPLRDVMDKARVDTEDVLDAARETHGLESFGQIKHAVLERSGKISIIPREK